MAFLDSASEPTDYSLEPVDHDPFAAVGTQPVQPMPEPASYRLEPVEHNPFEQTDQLHRLMAQYRDAPYGPADYPQLAQGGYGLSAQEMGAIGLVSNEKLNALTQANMPSARVAAAAMLGEHTEPDRGEGYLSGQSYSTLEHGPTAGGPEPDWTDRVSFYEGMAQRDPANAQHWSRKAMDAAGEGIGNIALSFGEGGMKGGALKGVLPLHGEILPPEGGPGVTPSLAQPRESLGRGGPGLPARDRGLEEAQDAAAAAANGRPPLAGLPQKPIRTANGNVYIPGPNDEAHHVAEQYMREAGLPYNPPKTHVTVNPERATRIAQAFADMKHDPAHPDVQASYEAMKNETAAQYDAILKYTGMKVEMIPPDMPDPAAETPRLAIQDMRDNRHWWGFPTDAGFGTGPEAEAAMKENPLLEQSGRFDANGKPMMYNDLFRFVHDYFGHFKDGNGFRASEEENAWRSHAAMYSDLARNAMTAETRGQNSYVNYGPDAEFNKTASGYDTKYAPQKIGKLPDWVVEEGRHDPGIEQPTGTPQNAPNNRGGAQGVAGGPDVPGHQAGLAQPSEGGGIAPVEPAGGGRDNSGLIPGDVGSHGAVIKQRFEPAPESREYQAREARGFANPVYHELDPQKGGAEAFANYANAARETNPHGASLTPYSADQSRNMRLFITPNGEAGGALKPNGDIVSLFKHPDSPLKGVNSSLQDLLISQGGNRLDAFDTKLPPMYAKNGFRAVARVPWNNDYRPPGWNEADFAQFNHGRPDVVYMVHDPEGGGYRYGDGLRVETPEEAEALQDQELKYIKNRQENPPEPKS